MKIVADRDIPFLRGVPEPHAEVVYLPGDGITARDVADADALLVRTRTRCDSALLAGSRVRFIGTATIGYDHIDTGYCAGRGITVATAKGSNVRGVLQWVAASLAWLADNRGVVPENTTIGIIGVGCVGSLVCRYASEWGFRVLCSDPPRESAERLGARDGFLPLDGIISQSDIITLHVPLTLDGADATYNMVNGGFIARAKENAVIINSSRGAVVEPEALRRAVAENRRRFIIDTWNNEPDIDRRVLGGVLLGTSHIAGYSWQGKATATAMIVNALAAEFGLPLAGWFPPESAPSVPKPISWHDMRRTISGYFDISAESSSLKARPQDFERMRGSCNYRQEYF